MTSFSLRAIDSGISDGVGKIPYDRDDTGASALIPEDLPEWRVIQQRGRINRDPATTGFDSGIFILYSNKERDKRPQGAKPEIERVSLTNLVLKSVSLGIDPTTLKLATNKSQEN